MSANFVKFENDRIHTFRESKKCNLMKILECCVLKVTFQSEFGTRRETTN